MLSDVMTARQTAQNCCFKLKIVKLLSLMQKTVSIYNHFNKNNFYKNIFTTTTKKSGPDFFSTGSAWREVTGGKWAVGSGRWEVGGGTGSGKWILRATLWQCP